MAVLNTARAVIRDSETRRMAHVIKDELGKLRVGGAIIGIATGFFYAANWALGTDLALPGALLFDYAERCAVTDGRFFARNTWPDPSAVPSIPIWVI